MDKRLKVMREIDEPSDKLFIGLGWDEDDQTNRKHYRQFHADELENKKDEMTKTIKKNCETKIVLEKNLDK